MVCCYLVEHNYGTMREVQEMDSVSRLSCFYTSMAMAGYEVDWGTGALSKKKS